MKTSNTDYELITVNKGVNLILLDRNLEADISLRKLSRFQEEGEIKTITLSMIGMNKFQLIGKYYSGRKP